MASGARMGWPVWSADGKRIFYASERAGPWQVWSRAADGSDEERPISKADSSVTPSAVSPDGSEVLVHCRPQDTGSDVEVMDCDRDDPTARPLGRRTIWPHFLTGREWIAYSSDESGRHGVYVRPRSGPRPLADLEPGRHEPRWVLDDEIAYLQGTKIMTVPVKTSPSFTAGRLGFSSTRNASDFDLARDGRILIVEAPDPSAAPGRLNVVVNWFEEIRRR